jgi:hypothetical protein
MMLSDALRSRVREKGERQRAPSFWITSVLDSALLMTSPLNPLSIG